VLAVGLVAPFQLLGLGHLMTILGCLAMTLATSAVILRFHRLGEAATFWAITGLLTFCYLSYTAALLFEGCLLVAAVPLLWKRTPQQARALGAAALLAALLAFVLYYGNWAWPFLVHSLPKILHGSGAPAGSMASDTLSRLALLPDKLAYSYGSAVVPLLGLLGLLRLARSPERLFLVLWGGVLVAFSGIDLYFNLLLKHHYFSMAPIAIGGGVFLARLWETGRAGRAAAVILLAFALLLGLETALAVALGEIP
jgi:hypothetical protein